MYAASIVAISSLRDRSLSTTPLLVAAERELSSPDLLGFLDIFRLTMSPSSCSSSRAIVIVADKGVVKVRYSGKVVS